MRRVLWLALLLCSACDDDGGGGMDAAIDAGEVSSNDAGDPETDAGPAEDAGPPPPGELRDSITQYGITWTFASEVEAGQFVTGDWWVVGPVEVVSVDPTPTAERNNSMLDPVGDQAYDARAGSYDAAGAVSFPLTIDAEHSLVSSISHPDTPACMQGGADGWETYDGRCQRGPIDTQAVLTVLAETPPGDAFRPAYSAHGPRLHRASELCMARLPTLSAPSSVPDGASVVRHMERPWIDHLGSWTMQHGCATNNMFCYGREIGEIVSLASTYALLDTPERETVVRQLVQLGIDNAGVRRAGGGWGADGGHFNGRKWPMVFASGLLGDPELAALASERAGNEDQMTYVGAEGTALWGRVCDSCYFAAGCDYAGGCDRGSRDCRDPAEVVDGCSSYRNCCTSPTWIGEALAAHVTGLVETWDHPPFFEYVDRWMAGDVDGGGSASSGFVDAMWAMHRDAPAAGGCP